ncbi:MAG: hypothetical protein ABI693_19065 [Bryobacteraceae bacterium]
MVCDGHDSFAEQGGLLRTLGVDPVVVDVFDQALLLDIVRKPEPEIVVHQLTDLPPGLDLATQGPSGVYNIVGDDEPYPLAANSVSDTLQIGGVC